MVPIADTILFTERTLMFIARATPPDAATDAEFIALERIAAFRAAHAVAQPTVGELMGRTVQNTDFLGDFDRDRHILAAVTAVAEAAEARREEEHACPQYGVPLVVIQDVSAALVQYAHDLFATKDEARVEVRVEAGDLDQDGELTSCPRYWSV
jgi:hypothetical protein